ncbi:MAG: magnesium transporter [Candidatus Aenigmarchaeota archaeon]|nr:magnesium transporter [Candidatus Aenigmarchaeota archaeon]
MKLRRDFKEMLSAELLAMTGGLFGGLMLAFFTKKFELIPGLLILLPGFLEMRGNISGTLSGRLSSGLFVGAIKPRIKLNKILKGNIIAAVIMAVVISFFLGLLAYLMSSYVFGISDVRIIMLALIAGLLSNLLEIPLTIFATFWLFRRGHDPSNIMGPYVTTTGDVVSILSLFVTVMLI